MRNWINGFLGMQGDKLLKCSIGGTILTAICCFTPILVLGLGAVGLAAATDWLDVILLPLLAGFLCLTAYAVYRRRRLS
jgi:mercuric ion transport protein